MENVTFWYGTYADYSALVSKDQSALYFITDKNVIYKGTTLVTDRYSITVISQNGVNVGVRLHDKISGTNYDMANLTTVLNLLQNNESLRFYKLTVSSNAELLDAIEATSGEAGSGTVEAGTVFRVQLDDPSAKVQFDPAQNGAGALVAKHHDLIVALYDVASGNYTVDGVEETWKRSDDVFAIIPTDLVDLVTASGMLGLNKVILGNNGTGIKALNFAGASKILRTNSSNDGVEWVSPETVQNVIVWNQIPSA